MVVSLRRAHGANSTLQIERPQPLDRLRPQLPNPERDLHLFHAFDKGFELARPRRMTQLAQRLGFNLPDALARYLEALAHFFERMLGAVFEAEAHLDDALLARRERAQNLRCVLLQVHADHRF